MKLVLVYCFLTSPYNCQVYEVPQKEFNLSFACATEALAEVVKFKELYPNIEIKSWGCVHGHEKE